MLLELLPVKTSNAAADSNKLLSMPQQTKLQLLIFSKLVLDDGGLAKKQLQMIFTLMNLEKAQVDSLLKKHQET